MPTRCRAPRGGRSGRRRARRLDGDPGRQRDDSALEHRVARVEAEVDEEPLELARLDLDPRRRRGRGRSSARCSGRRASGAPTRGGEAPRRGRGQRRATAARTGRGRAAPAAPSRSPVGARDDEHAVEAARASLPVADDVDEVARLEDRPVRADDAVLEHVVARRASSRRAHRRRSSGWTTCARSRVLEPARHRVARGDSSAWRLTKVSRSVAGSASQTTAVSRSRSSPKLSRCASGVTGQRSAGLREEMELRLRHGLTCGSGEIRIESNMSATAARCNPRWSERRRYSRPSWPR